MVAKGESDDVVLLDGEHLLDEAITAGVPIEVVLTDGRPSTVVSRARTAGAVVYEGSRAVIEAASPVQTPTGVVALAQWRPAPLPDVVAAANGACLGLVGVQDPGNVGSAIRAADALGATGVLALDASASPRGWKTLRGAMGSTFRIPVGTGTAADAISIARRQGLAVVAAVAASGTAVDRLNLKPPSLILVGSEGSGLPADVVSQASHTVTIPMRAGIDSMNVAVTAALLLFELRRQRQKA